MLTIEQLREQIRNIDHDMIRNLARRQSLCKKIAPLKKKAGKPILDPDQEQKNFKYYEVLSKKYDTDFELIKRLFQLIIINARRIQQDF